MAPPGSPPPSDDEAPRGVDLWLRPYFSDASLWPVLAVVVSIAVVFGAWALLLAAVDRSLFALGALVLLFWMGVDAGVRSRRRGGSGLLLGGLSGLWLLSIAAATVAHRMGWY